MADTNFEVEILDASPVIEVEVTASGEGILEDLAKDFANELITVGSTVTENTKMNVSVNGSTTSVPTMAEFNALSEDIAVKADKTALAKTEEKIDALWKLNEGQTYDFYTDSTSGYEKTVPAGAKFADVLSVGGMSRKGKNIAVLTSSNIVSEQRCTKTEITDGIKFESTGSYGRVGYSFDVESGKTYTISFYAEKVSTSDHNTTIYINNQNTWNYYYLGQNLGSSITQKIKYTKTFTANSNILFVGFYISAGDYYGDALNVTEFQLEEGSTATAYEPYTDSLIDAKVDKVVSCGRNLLSTTFYSSTSWEYSKGVIEKRTGYNGFCFDPIDVEGGETYYWYCSDTTNYRFNYFYIELDDGTIHENRQLEYSDWSPIYGATNAKASYTMPDNAKKLYVNYYTSKRPNETPVNICINKSDSMNGTYSPYRTPVTKTIPTSVIALCPDYGIGVSADCCNYIDFENKKYHKRVGKVDLGTLNFGYYAETSTLANRFAVQFSGSNPLCALYTTVPNVNEPCDKCVFSKDGWINVVDSSYTDASAFKTAMNGVMLYYELATEQVVDLSSALTDDYNLIDVEAGGTIQMHYPKLDDGYAVSVPNTIEYIRKLDEVTTS